MSKRQTTSYTCQAMPQNAPTVGMHYVHGENAPQYHFIDRNMGADEYQLAVGPELYIPPIVEDEKIPNDFKLSVQQELVDNGEIPYKRVHINVPGLLDIDEEGTQGFNFHDGDVDIDFEVLDVDWGDYVLIGNDGYVWFFHDMMDSSDFFGAAYRPFDSFDNRMSTAEFNINYNEYKFGKVRTILPFVAYALGCSALWLKHHLEAVQWERGPGLFYKAMVNMHCVFTMEYNSNFPANHSEVAGAPQTEYRCFIFNKMCEAPDGKYLQAWSNKHLFKIAYNSFLELCYEKLDDENIGWLPDVDSHFFFYALRTVSVTVFQYELLAVGMHIKLDERFSKGRCVLNPKVDEGCFCYAVLLGILMYDPKVKGIWVSMLVEKSMMDAMFSVNGITADFSDLDEGLFLYNEKDLDCFCVWNPNLFLTVWVPSERADDQVPLHLIYQTPAALESCVEINLLLLIECEEPNDEDEPALGYVNNLVHTDCPLVNHHFVCIINLDGLFSAPSGDHGVHVCPVCKVRQTKKNRARGFCELHEPVEFQMAVNGEGSAHGDIKRAFCRKSVQYHHIMSTLCPKCANYFPDEQALVVHMGECLIKD